MFEFLKLDANGDDKPDDGAVFSFRWHDLRHEFASHLAENGVPLVQVKDFLGHVGIVTTERYVTTQPERLQIAVQTLNPPDAAGTTTAATADVSQSLHTAPSDAATPTDPKRVS